MGIINFILNILWLILGGGLMGLCWFFAAIICFISIIGIPFGRACFVIGKMTLWPFGRTSINRRYLSGTEDIGTSTLGTIGNVIWLLLFGIWLAIGHFVLAVAYFITIIGIPFGIQHFKLGLLSLMPIGQSVITKSWFN